MLRFIASIILLTLAILPAQAKHHHHHIHSTSTILGNRPAGCPSAWCGCWLGRFLGHPDRALWLAANWAHIGQPASGPAPGIVAVWRHHVGVVTAVLGRGIIVLKSGNDGHAVRERARSAAGVIAWRRV